MTAPAIGIDLGTSYSSVAVYRDGRVEVIPNEEGDRITPSYVAFTETERLVGSAAKNQVAINPTNTVYDTKRLIGRTFYDPMVQEDLNTWPFQVIDNNSKPKIVVQYKGKSKYISPEEVSSMVLNNMREIAENYLKTKVENAVISVPAYFNDCQRQATIDAATIAGLNVFRIINEPAAAALAYRSSYNNTADRNILIFDLGGGTCDVSVLSIEDKILCVHSSAGNSHLGGQDLDNRLIDYFVSEILREYKKDLRTDETAMRRLRNACESAKKKLSVSKEAIIDLDYLFDGISFQSSITRSLFEGLNMDLFKSMIKLVDEAVEESGMEKTVIDDIVLVGGSTRIPMVQSLLSEYFNGKELVRSVNPDEAVACGAAIQAAILNGEEAEEIKYLRLLDVTSMSLGMDGLNDTDILIPKNSLIPVQKTEIFTTTVNLQSAVCVDMYQGDINKSNGNYFLGRYVFDGIYPLPLEVPQIYVTFEVDANGILDVTAAEESSQITRIIDTTATGRLTKDEVKEMVNEARKYRMENDLKMEVIKAKNELESLCLNTIAKLEEKKLNEESDELENALEICYETFTWLDTNQETRKFDCIRRHLELRRISYMVE